MSDSGLFKKIRDFYDKYIDKKFVRFLLLIGTGGFGLLFGKLADVQFFRYCLGLHETVAEYLATAVVGIFAFILLWYFRTRDVRQQIEKIQEQIQKSQKQIDQNYFNNAIGNLTSNMLIKEEIGVQSLIKLSEVTPEFNELIIIAFGSAIDGFKSYIIDHEREVRPNQGWASLQNNSNKKSSYGDKNKYTSRKKLINDMEIWLEDIEAKEEKENDEILR